MADDWQRLADFIADRMAETNMNQADLMERSGLSQPSVAGLVGGQPRAQSPRTKTLWQLEDGLGWRRDSVADILAGGEPVVVAPPTGSGATPPDVVARVERLEQDLAQQGVDLAGVRDDLVAAIDHWTAEQRALVAAVELLAQRVGDP